MSQSKSSSTQNKQSDTGRTEADKAAGKSKTEHKTSGNDKSHTKAGSDHGAGGGAKQERKH
jgi:hypothetical protein